MRPKPLAQGRAIRALVEAGQPIEMVAQAADRSARMLAKQAEREGWLIAPPPSHDIGAKVREVANMLVARIEEASRAALENGGIINKSEIDSLAYLIKSLNGLIGIEGDSRAEELAIKKQNTRNEHRAEILKRINERIVELAEEIAARLVGDRDRVGRG